MKKILLSTAALLFVAPMAMAADYNSSNNGPTPADGFYLGGFGGYTMTDAETDVGGIDFEPRGADYGVFAGYRLDRFLDETINRTGLGLNGALEVHYAWSTADDSDAGVEFEKNNEWGVSFRPGLTIIDDFNPFSVTPYGIIGYRRTEFEASAGGFSGDENYDGFELGIGTEFLAYGNYGVRLDYSHVWYGEENGIDPDEDDLRLGVAYHF